MTEPGGEISINKVNPTPNVVPSGDRPPTPQEGKDNPPAKKPEQKKTELGDTPPRLDQGQHIDKLG